MALTRVSPALFQVSNNITSVTVGGSANTISLTFDSNGVITGASNNAVSVANTAITGNIIGSQISSNTLSNTVFQTGSVENYMNAAGLGFGMRNRIINGAMVIDQRNAGASVTPTNGQYTLDRWQANLTAASKYTIQQSSTAATGFTKSLLVTSSSAYSVGSGDQFNILQKIEGFNIADLGFGAAGASSITLSFWVRSSLTGTFSGSINNGAFTRNYIFNYTVSSANTWTQISVTVTGDTSGSWTTDNSAGLNIVFGLGSGSTYSGTAGSWGSTYYTQSTGSVSVVGTSGATFYITGVQLEKGSTATSFDYRPYGTELQLCYRYFQKSFALGTAPANGLSEYGNAANTTSYATAVPYIYVKYQVQLRVTPSTINFYNPRSGGTAGQITNASADGSGTAITNSGEKGFMVQSAAQGANNWYVHWDASSEL